METEIICREEGLALISTRIQTLISKVEGYLNDLFIFKLQMHIYDTIGTMCIQYPPHGGPTTNPLLGYVAPSEPNEPIFLSWCLGFFSHELGSYGFSNHQATPKLEPCVCEPYPREHESMQLRSI